MLNRVMSLSPILQVTDASEETARKISIRRLVIDPSCRRTNFAQRNWREHFREERLTVHPDDLQDLACSPKFEFDDLEEVSFPRGATFMSAVELSTDQTARDKPQHDFRLRIGAGAIIGKGVKIRVLEGVEIGKKGKIGNNCRVENSVIGERVNIGDRVKMHGVKIGNDSVVSAGSIFGRDANTEIGAKARIGVGFEVYGEGDVVIGDRVIIGDKTSVYATQAGTRIGDDAAIGSFVDLRASIQPGQSVKAKDAPNLPIIFHSLYRRQSQRGFLHSPLSSEDAKMIVRNYINCINGGVDDDSVAICTANATHAINSDPTLFFFPQLNPIPEGKFVRVDANKLSVIVLCEHGKIKYFGAEEIGREYIAGIHRINKEEKQRLEQFIGLLPGVLAAMNISQWGDSDKVGGIRKYAGTPINEAYMLFGFICRHFGWNRVSTRFLDVGSGDGAVVKIANLFVAAEGIERNARRHRVAIQHLSEGSAAILSRGDFFECEWSPFSAVYLYMELPVTRGRILSHNTPFARKLRRKLGELNSGALIIFGPQGIRWGDIGVTSYDTLRIGKDVLSQIAIPEDLILPERIKHYGLFRRV